jgi:polar amino acid transport system substrate-binding protein
MRRRLTGIGLTMILVSFVLVAAGCGSDKKSGSSTAASTGNSTATGADSTVAALVSAAVKKKGTLKVAADATYPPNEFLAANGHTVQGMDADLADAIAKVMGLKAQVVNATFDAIIPGLAAHKYDLGMSSFTDTKEREQTVDFVTYFSAGTSFYIRDGGPKIQTLADLCGEKVAVEKGTTQADDVTAQAKKCKAAGKPEPQLQTFPDQNGANLAISSGRAEVGMADSPVAAYQVKKSDGQFKLSGQPYGTAPYGIAMPKDTGMTKPVLAAMKAVIANGTYGRIMKKWGLQPGAIDNPAINAAVS